jgi:hypothetical protein
VSDPAARRRIVSTPSTGARVCLLIAVVVAVAACYFLLAPVQVNAQSGRTFDCGTVMNGPSTAFAKGICGKANNLAGYRAASLAVMALFIGVGGFVVFGFQRREERAVRSATPDQPADPEA